MARDRASRPEAAPLRLFVAVEVPEDVRDGVRSAVGPLRERFPRARWVPSANQHVTMKFLGATWPRLVERVSRSVELVALRNRPVPTRVAGAGAFPSPRRARVLWVGLEDLRGSLAAIASDLDLALAPEFEPESRAFTPHLTVARFDPPVPLGDELAGVEVDTRPFEVADLVLFRSRPQRPAPVYEALGRFPLGS